MYNTPMTSDDVSQSKAKAWRFHPTFPLLSKVCLCIRNECTYTGIQGCPICSGIDHGCGICLCLGAVVVDFYATNTEMKGSTFCHIPVFKL